MCNDGDLRLIGGSNNTEGRVEVCYNEAWGTICDNGFDNIDASVICGQLGFSRRSEFNIDKLTSSVNVSNLSFCII